MSAPRYWATRFVVGGVSAASIVVGGSYAYYRRRSISWLQLPPSSPSLESAVAASVPESGAAPVAISEEDELRIVAECFSKEVFLVTFKDEAVLNELVRLLLRAFRHETVKAAFVKFLKEQFTEHPATVAAYRKFLLDDVIGDPWVKEGLVALALELGDKLVADPLVWPEATLEMLGATSLDAISSEAFLAEVREAIRAGVLGDAQQRAAARAEAARGAADAALKQPGATPPPPPPPPPREA